MSAHRGFFFLEPLSLIDCCVQERSFCFWYFNSKLDSRVISNGSSLQSRGILLCDRHGLSTDRDLGESKMIPRKRVTRCLLFLHIPLGRTLKKKTKKQNKTKKPVLHAGYIPCTSEYNHKIPFQCFISINSNTDPNFTTTFVKGCFKCQKQFFFRILTNGNFSFYFFADRFEVKKPRFFRAVSEFFL